MKTLVSIFYKYFFEKVDIQEFSDAKFQLERVVGTYCPDVEDYSFINKKELKNFVKLFYKMKQNLEKRYNSIRDYSNSLEGKSRPLIRKLISKNSMREIVRLYPKFEKFETLVNKRLNISMAQIYFDLQQEKQKATPIIKLL